MSVDWVSATADLLSVGDVVRVRQDAYTGRPGAVHNGRVGLVLGVGGGNVSILVVDENRPKLGMVYHSPHRLERMKTYDSFEAS